MKKHYLFLTIVLSVILFACTGNKSEKEEKDDDKKDRKNEEVNVRKSDHPEDNLIPDFEKTSDESVLLRYKFTKGEKITFKFITNIDIHTTAGDVNMNMGMRGHYHVDTVYPDGSALAMFYLSDIITKTTGLAEMSFDSRNEDDRNNYQYQELSNLVETNIPVLVTPTGELPDMSRNPHAQALAAASSFYDNQQLESLLQGSFTQLSEEPVKKGDIYEAGNLKTVATQQSMSFDISYLIEAVSGDKKQVIMVPKADIESEETIEESDFTGRILFDLDKGNIVRSFGTMEMSMTIQNQQADFKIKIFYETDL